MKHHPLILCSRRQQIHSQLINLQSSMLHKCATMVSHIYAWPGSFSHSHKKCYNEFPLQTVPDPSFMELVSLVIRLSSEYEETFKSPCCWLDRGKSCKMYCTETALPIVYNLVCIKLVKAGDDQCAYTLTGQMTRHQITDLKVFVIVIPKEGWACVAGPILLLVWHRLFRISLFIHSTQLPETGTV